MGGFPEGYTRGVEWVGGPVAAGCLTRHAGPAIGDEPHVLALQPLRVLLQRPVKAFGEGRLGAIFPLGVPPVEVAPGNVIVVQFLDSVQAVHPAKIPERIDLR